MDSLIVTATRSPRRANLRLSAPSPIANLPSLFSPIPPLVPSSDSESARNRRLALVSTLPFARRTHPVRKPVPHKIRPSPPSPTTSRIEIAAPLDTRPFILAFNRLNVLFADFCKRFSTDHPDCELSAHLAEFSKCCQVFLKQATVHLSCVAPDLDLRASASSSTLHRSGRRLLECWKIFIEDFNISESEGLGPYTNRINSSFDTIFDAIATIRFSMSRFQFKTDNSCIALQNFQDSIVLLRDEIFAVLEQPMRERFVGFLPKVFQRRIAATMHAISDLFDHALLHSCLTVAVTVSCRTELSSAVAGIAVAMEMARQNGEIFNELRAQIFEVNQQLTLLFEKLRFPFALALVLSEKTVEINDSEGNLVEE
jgi:hypothetical protein